MTFRPETEVELRYFLQEIISQLLVQCEEVLILG